MAVKKTFVRTERLKSHKTITNLFSGKAQSFACYPMRLVFSEIPPPLSIEAQNTIETPIEVAFSVPKRTFKRANKRNLLRRRMREAYRLSKNHLYNIIKSNDKTTEKRYAFMLLYTAKEELPYVDIEKGISKMIFKFKQEIGVSK